MAAFICSHTVFVVMLACYPGIKNGIPYQWVFVRAAFSDL